MLRGRPPGADTIWRFAHAQLLDVAEMREFPLQVYLLHDLMIYLRKTTAGPLSPKPGEGKECHGYMGN